MKTRIISKKKRITIVISSAVLFCGCELDSPTKCTCESDTIVSCFNNSSFDEKIDCTKTDQMCSEGKCIDIECHNGERGCSASGVPQECKSYYWRVGQPCSNLLVCKAGQCVDKQCENDARRCNDAGVPQRCVNALWEDETPCSHDMKCLDGKCEKITCYNGYKDDDEDAIDCGGPCAPCIDCSETKQSDLCPEGYFCDSEYNYVCNKKCTADTDCKDSDKWDGEFCRKDYRCASKIFETVWIIENNNEKIVLPYVGNTISIDDTDYPNLCAFRILWGDENASADIASLPLIEDCDYAYNRSHTYAKPGLYSIKIIGTYDGWGHLTNAAQSHSLISIKSFGPVGLSQYAFANVHKDFDIDTSAGIPDATKLRTMQGMFSDTDSKIWENETFLQPLRWDTSQVIDMSYTFYDTKKFNQPLPFDTKHAITMAEMFSSASAFNQPLTFNTSNVKDMRAMFANASAFNQPLTFNTFNVKNMRAMFSGASAFNQPLKFNTSNVTDMSYMFENASAFNQDISAWDFSHITDANSILEASGISDDNYCKFLKSASLQDFIANFITEDAMTYFGKNAACGE